MYIANVTFQYSPEPPAFGFLSCAVGNSERQSDVRHRAGKGGGGGQDGRTASEDVSCMKNDTTHISVTFFGEVQSDMTPQEPLQKVVRFSPDLSLLLTGGTDGHIRVWEVKCSVTCLSGVSFWDSIVGFFPL